MEGHGRLPTVSPWHTKDDSCHFNNYLAMKSRMLDMAFMMVIGCHLLFRLLLADVYFPTEYVHRDYCLNQ